MEDSGGHLLNDIAKRPNRHIQRPSASRSGRLRYIGMRSDHDEMQGRANKTNNILFIHR